jgi:hypothetical protein
MDVPSMSAFETFTLYLSVYAMLVDDPNEIAGHTNNSHYNVIVEKDVHEALTASAGH